MSSLKINDHRISSLDGLRGVAILLVILNHLHLYHLYELFPLWSHPLLSSILNSGRVGVSILFLLSGFLMATYYPRVAGKISFFQKRYTRIVPAFFSMSLALSVIRYFWNSLSPLSIIVIVLSVTVLSGLVWKFIQKTSKRRQVGKTLFSVYFAAQVLVLVGYILLHMFLPPAIYYIVWPASLRQVVVFLVNAFMVNPFGIYVPLIDGAYWSIATEIVFYLLYPIFFLPILGGIINKRSKWFIFICVALCFPFFYSIFLLFPSILSFQTFSMELGIYFVFGVGIGLLKASQKFIFPDVSQHIPSSLLTVMAFVICFGLPFFRGIINVGQLDVLFWVLPISLVFMWTLGNTTWSSILASSPLVRLGRISYSLYLVHTISIELISKIIVPDTLFGMSVQAILSIITMIVLASSLYFFLEKPYFTNKIKEVVKAKRKVSLSPTLRPTLVGFSLFLFLVWYGYHVPSPLTSRVVNHKFSLTHLIPIGKPPTTFRFTAPYPNLGLMRFNVKILDDSEVKNLGLKRGQDPNESFSATIKDDSGKILSNNSFALYQMYDTRFHPIGLPLEPKSKGRVYAVTFTAPEKALQRLAIVNDGTVFRTVYFQSKKDLILNPIQLIETIFEKITQPFTEPNALCILLLSLPLWFLILFKIPSLRFHKES